MATSNIPFSLKILLILLYCLYVLLAFTLANRRGRLLVAGLFILFTLILPPSLLVENEEMALTPVYGFLFPGRESFDPLPGWANLLELLVFLLPSVVLSTGVIVSTVTFATGIQLHRERARSRAAGLDHVPERRNRDDGYAGANLVLSGLVLLATLYNLYWLTVLDKTSDSVGIIYLVFTAPVVILSGGLLLLQLFRKGTLAGLLYALLVPAAFVAVFIAAGRVDYRALTDARAERISRAIAAYHTREGRYPESLGQLVPRFLLTLPRPAIINGQDWCYEGDEDGYVFGYVDREHWSSPELFGHLSSTAGFAKDLPNLCEDEIRIIQEMRGW